ncbi:serine aminopeptidase domain-containing protein [Mucilaginibacter sp.]|jgi:pimeloyl-ACP methyl ester carboxylesterase|uniref:serine aminopeptidase domain-containing protein n=1 Tax=Mucilaginibacter sp. TaxID=1882438 RepID=UPI002C969A2F|nr:alpha/beta hydrolase [Mucilaginibacter sp.]HTI58191.1 alpha/beta hydrolase [Mucilaginibacter sp.]
MKKTIFLLLAVISIKASAQTEPANYAAAVNKFKLFYNNNQPDSIYKMFGPQMVAALTLDNFKGTTTQLRSQLGNLTQTDFTSFTPPVGLYKATFQNAALALRISLNDKDQIIGLLLKPLDAPAEAAKPESAESAPKTTTMDPSLVESPISLKTLSATIHGTLTMPKNASGKIPVVLIIAGSGPTDRNGNSEKLGLETNAYKDIAEGLGKNGIASVRYDKRMIGESQTGNKEADLRFDDYVDDAVGLVQMLNGDERFSKVIILGHSEGSLVGMLATRDQPVKGYISVSGAGQRADKIITEQLKTQPKFIQDGFKTLTDSMKKGKTIDNIDPGLYFIARPSIQKYLVSWFRYDPFYVIKSVKVPTLIIQGTTDLQVAVTDAERLKKGKSDATLIIIPGMNHVLKDAPADKDQNLATYKNPDLPLKAELIPDIVKFINGIN